MGESVRDLMARLGLEDLGGAEVDELIREEEGELVRIRFRDANTGEIRVVVQYYESKKWVSRRCERR